MVLRFLLAFCLLTSWPLPAAHAARSGGTLTMLVDPEPASMTAAQTSVLPNQYVAPKIYGALFSYDNAFNLIPSLALSYAQSPDGLSVTIRLRPGVKWQDGAPFTADDVAWSLINVWKKLHSRGRVTYANVTGVETPDPLTVLIHLSAPSPIIRTALGGFESEVLPKHLYDGTDPLTNPANDHPIGAGPFRFIEWQHGSRIILERNPDYWEAEKPYLDRIVIRIIPDAASRAAALETGEVLLGPQTPVPLADVERLAKLPNLEITSDGYGFANFLQVIEFNLHEPHLKDVRVRQAIAEAINRNFLARAVWRGYGTAATGPVPSALKPYYTTDVPHYDYNVADANKKLDEAGYKRDGSGIRFSLAEDWAPYGPEDQKTAEYLRQALKSIGIDLAIRNQDLPTYFHRIYTDYDFQLTNYFTGVGADPTASLQRLYWSKSVQRGAPFTNASGYANPVMDQLLETSIVTSDVPTRVGIVAAFQRLAMTDLPLLPLIEIHSLTIANRRVHDHTTGPEGLRSTFAAVWIDP